MIFCHFTKFSQEVQFCGYSIPHPSEDIMNVRIQSHSKRKFL